MKKFICNNDDNDAIRNLLFLMKVQENSKTNPQEKEESNILEDCNDDYLVLLHKKYLEMKEMRKKAEQDTAVLKGRVQCLHGEEEKNNKKIEVTRKKTQDKMEQINQQKEDNQMKMKFKEMKEKELQDLKERNKKILESKKLEDLMRREEKERDIVEEAKALKEQRKQNEEMIKYNKLEDQSNAKTKADYIKSQQAIAEEKRRAFELEKKFQIKTEMERKIMEEIMMKEEAEKKKIELEEEEIEIMKRIKTTTQTHQMMVDQLEKLSSSKNNTATKSDNVSPNQK